MPFEVTAVCLLPDHLHCVWSLPEGDHDHVSRWHLISNYCMKHHRHPSPAWEPRYRHQALTNWDDRSLAIDYLHVNPVRHGLCKHPGDWSWSSYHRYVAEGTYQRGWPTINNINLDESSHNLPLFLHFMGTN